MPKVELRLMPNVEMAPRRAFELAVAIKEALQEQMGESPVNDLFLTGFEIEVRWDGAYCGTVGFHVREPG